MDLDPAGSDEAHDPDEPSAGSKELPDLDRQIRLVLTSVGILHRQRRCALHPARGVGHVADGQIRGTQGVVVGGIAGVHASGVHRWVGRQGQTAHQTGPGASAPGGQTLYRVAIGELVGIPGLSCSGRKGPRPMLD
jgi:hypothetical protein